MTAAHFSFVVAESDAASADHAPQAHDRARGADAFVRIAAT
jgi:hypothetical protein